VPRTYDPEFRRRGVELVRAGRPVRLAAAELGLAAATVYRWKAQDLIDRGIKPGTSTNERGELAAARRRIKELEPELALVKQAAKLFEEGVRPKATYPVIAELTRQGFSAKRCCRLLGVAASGFFMWRRRSPSPRQLRFAWLTELVRAIHADSRGTDGWRRVNAELAYGHGVVVNRKTVRKIMRLHGAAWAARIQEAVPPHGQRRDHRRPGRAPVRPPSPRPVVGHRHHRAPDARGQGVLLRSAGRVLPPGGGLVHRHPSGHPAGNQRPWHGDQQPQPATRPDGHP
jgi:putative transposase